MLECLLLAKILLLFILRTTALSQVTTLVGTGSTTATLDGVVGLSTNIDNPSAVWSDSVGNLFFGDYAAPRVRKVAVSTYLVTTVAGQEFSAQQMATEVHPQLLLSVLFLDYFKAVQVACMCLTRSATALFLFSTQEAVCRHLLVQAAHLPLLSLC